MYEFKGIVKKIGELQTFSKGFTKRELVVEEDRQGTWKNVVSFVFKKDHVAKLHGLKVGASVTVKFAVDGREWTDPKTGNVRYFTDLTALGLTVWGGETAEPEPAAPDADVLAEADDDRIPF